MPARLQFDLGLGPGARPRRQAGAQRLLVLGDFSAAPTGARKPLAERPTHRVDIDELDRVMQRLAPRLTLPQGELVFEGLDDFHPDALYARLGLFNDLRNARSQPPTAGADLLGSLLGSAPGRAPAAAASAAPAVAGIDALIRQIVAPHIVPDTTAQTGAYVAAVDAAIAEQMRQLLHEPALQALESAWRGVQWLVSSLDLGDELELHLLDVSRDELHADIVQSQGRLAETGLHRALADRWRNQPGGQGWSMLVGLLGFGGSETDVGLLAALGLIAAQAGGPFVAQGDETLAAAPTPSWQALRRSEAAPWIGLACPRVLLRRPYGRKTDPVDSFAFEEFPGAPPHEQLLWGNPALAVALLAGRGGPSQVLEDLPSFTVLQDGEPELQPCAERFLGEEAGNALLAAGLMPIASHRHAHAATVLRLQSVADPATALGGAG